MNNFLITPIEYLKGVGPQKAELLKKELGIFSYKDLLEYYPFRYVDRSQFHTVADLVSLQETNDRRHKPSPFFKLLCALKKVLFSI